MDREYTNLGKLKEDISKEDLQEYIKELNNKFDEINNSNVSDKHQEILGAINDLSNKIASNKNGIKGLDKDSLFKVYSVFLNYYQSKEEYNEQYRNHIQTIKQNCHTTENSNKIPYVINTPQELMNAFDISMMKEYKILNSLVYDYTCLIYSLIRGIHDDYKNFSNLQIRTLAKKEEYKQLLHYVQEYKCKYWDKYQEIARYHKLIQEEKQYRSLSTEEFSKEIQKLKDQYALSHNNYEQLSIRNKMLTSCLAYYRHIHPEYIYTSDHELKTTNDIFKYNINQFINKLLLIKFCNDNNNINISNKDETEIYNAIQMFTNKIKQINK